jgi:general secretion pathway protein K
MTMRAHFARSLRSSHSSRSRFAPRGPRSQRGAAIITALLVVALSAILVSGMLWRQQVQLRRIENQRLIAQAQWISRGALDWTRLVLRSEADTSAGVTWLGGAWGMPVARTHLSDFLGQIGDARAEQGATTWISGSVEDAQARFNLRNLVTSSAPGALQLDLAQIRAFARLLQTLGIDGQLAKNTAVYLRAALAYSVTRFQTGSSTDTSASAAAATTATAQQSGGGAAGGATFTDDPGLAGADTNSAVAPLVMTSVDALLDVPGFTPEALARLRPFVTVLPTATRVNMNTASAEVISAIVTGMNVSQAQAFVERRQRVFFRNISDVQLALEGAGVAQSMIDTTLFDVDTNYFVVHSRVEHERAEVDRATLIWRDSLTHATRIVRVRDEP